MKRFFNQHLIISIFFLSLYAFPGHCTDQPIKYYSQVGQDEYMHKNIFPNKKNGIIVDIGANDGKTLSNSLFFVEQRGWKCMCIEPLPRAFTELKKNRPNCICIQGCISDKEGTDQFLEIRGDCEMLSGLTSKYDPRHVSRISYEIAQNRASYDVIQVMCYKLDSLLDAYGIDHVDILSVDTEGGEDTIIKSINLDRIDVICVEDNYGDQELIKYLLGKEFILLTSIAMDATSSGRDLIFRNKKYSNTEEI